MTKWLRGFLIAFSIFEGVCMWLYREALRMVNQTINPSPRRYYYGYKDIYNKKEEEKWR